MKSTTGLDLKNISAGGQPPESRLNDAAEVQDMVKQIIRADSHRSRVRAKLKGLVDGNPPYSEAELKRTGQSYRTNINWREAESYLGGALSAFYDVFAETSTYATVKIKHGTADEDERYSRVVTEEFDKLLKKDADFDYRMQLSQHEMVLYGIGPIVFEDNLDWRSRAIRAQDLLVPDGTKSNVDDWSVAVIRATYQVHELYGFIRNEEAAENAGWSVAAARKAIIEAAPEDYLTEEQTWEKCQQQIRNNDLAFSAKCDVVKVDHVYYREFPDDENPKGAISHCIINERGEAKSFMFRKVNRYKSWEEAIHCLYYDKGDGQHHSVKGLGIKMYSALALKNRLKCTLTDAAMARSSIHIKPKTPNDMNRTNVINMGPYSVLPSNYDVEQTTVAGALDAPMAVDREIGTLMQSNLSSYRQQMDKSGNPRTATEIEAIMSQQSTLNKTQLNRYYSQLDALFAEKYRRATNPNLTKDAAGGELALAFQKACKDRGVPSACLTKAERVQSTRSSGRGSVFAKQAVMNQLMGLVQMLPEGGRQNVIEDTIASLAGYASLERYYPQPKTDMHTQEEQQDVAKENILFKSGGIIPVSSGDNHAIHAGGHLQAGMEAVQIMQEGQPVAHEEVATFLRALLEHVSGHIAEVARDSSRKEVTAVFEDQFQQLAAVLSDLLGEINEAQQAAAQAAQGGVELANAEGGPIDTKDQIDMMRFEREEARRDMKTQADIERKAAKARQDLALKDAKTAAKLMEG